MYRVFDTLWPYKDGGLHNIQKAKEKAAQNSEVGKGRRKEGLLILIHL